MKQLALRILWPAFVAAGVLETMVFAVVDPADLHWFSGSALDWSTDAVYTVTFLIFWAAVSASSAVTALLSLEPKELNALQESR
ncbi:MAG: hypothetical protein H7Z19_18890 [Chitinophagaceae bacterium]|nr:hypothetical protein [Rubrivivax sp.]